jgi:hypothetical protein
MGVFRGPAEGLPKLTILEKAIRKRKKTFDIRCFLPLRAQNWLFQSQV